jgi:hypothetical protein
MRYEDFRRDYEAVTAACDKAQLDARGLEAALVRLRALGEALPGADQDRAIADLDSLEELLELAQTMPSVTDGPAVEEASRFLSEAMSEDGTANERLKRAERGMKRISKLAKRTRDPEEKFTIQRMAEPLAMLIDSLRTARRG